MQKGDDVWVEAKVRYAWERLAGYVCPLCKAAGKVMMDDCTAPCEEECPGIAEMDRLLAEFDRDWRAIVAVKATLQ
jgi:hypothetical protein